MNCMTIGGERGVCPLKAVAFGRCRLPDRVQLFPFWIADPVTDRYLFGGNRFQSLPTGNS